MTTLADRKYQFLNAFTLRCLALLVMFLGHFKKVVIPEQIYGCYWMTCLSALAFPIFAFQISEGFFHTRSRKKYALRLFVFALISEVPFDLMVGGSVFVLRRQNVMFTLLFGLLCLWLLRHMQEKGGFLHLALGVAGTMAACVIAHLGGFDYGMPGVLAVVLFGLTREKKCKWLWQLLGMILIFIVIYQLMYGAFTNWFVWLYRCLAVVSLVLIWCYNGKQGPKNKVLQLGAYFFYPAHMLLLVLLAHVV